jgi:hypothetical protein
MGIGPPPTSDLTKRPRKKEKFPGTNLGTDKYFNFVAGGGMSLHIIDWSRFA